MVHIELSARIGAMIVHAAAASGVSPAALQQTTGFDPAVADDPDARISLELEETLWNEAARRSGDDAFGIHAAEVAGPEDYSVLDYTVRSAPTARVALDRLVRYNRLVHDAAVFTVIDQGDVMRVEHAFRTPGAAPCRHAAEFTLASVIVIGAQITGREFRPRAVEFHHAAPASIGEHLRLFGVAPRFSMEVNALELDRSLLDRPLLTSDPALWRVIERHAETLLAARPNPAASMVQRVQRLLAKALREGDASLAGIAGQLRMSERSLQRRLADEGVSFDTLLDDLRRELALRYLGDRRMAIPEVAYLLGYSEPSAFHRAFKRWTGATPSEVRRRATASA